MVALYRFHFYYQAKFLSNLNYGWTVISDTGPRLSDMSSQVDHQM